MSDPIRNARIYAAVLLWGAALLLILSLFVRG